jgi:peptidoglycan/LPS O-acetylase OafA/YrhL
MADKERLFYLDGWRGISILLVLIGHFFPVAGINLGLLGVEFFFVLSGRLMAEILFIEQYPLKKFFKRRFSRIYPALLVYVLMTWVALTGTAIMFKWKAALTALTFTYNYAGLFKRVPALDHIWSLCVEEHAYVLLALIALVAVRRRKMNPLPILAVFAAIAMINGAVSYWVFNLGEAAAYWRTDVHISSILVAAFIRLARETTAYPPILKEPYVAVLATVTGATLFLGIVPLPLHYMIGTPLLALGINALDDAWPAVKKALSCRPLVTTGLLSFSIYLWQQPFYKFATYEIYATLPMLAAAIACAVVSFYAVERPARALLNKYW